MKNQTTNKMKTKNKNRRILGTLACALILTCAIATGLLWQPVTASGATAYTGYIAGIEQQSMAYTMLGNVNAARKTAAVGALKWDTTLENAAVVRAREVAIYFSHNRPTGALWYTACSKLNAENLYVGYKAGPTTANNGWMSSSGHRANRLNGTYKSYAAAAFQGKDGAVYWVELFSQSASASTAYRGVDVSKTNLPVTLTDGCLAIKSSITNLTRGTVADTDLRVGGSYYLTLTNWNKEFSYSYSLFSKGYFSSSNTAIAAIDSSTGKITAKRAGVVTLYGRTSTTSALLMKRLVVVRPQAVTGLLITPKAKAVSMVWNPIAGASGYEVYRSTTLSGTFTKVATLSAPTTTYTNSGLATGGNYYYKVRAYVLKSGSTTLYCGYYSTQVAAKVL